MNILNLEKTIQVNEQALSFASELSFIESLSIAGISNDLKKIESNGYNNYGFKCIFNGMKFSFNVNFKDNKRVSKPFMIWLEGRCHKLGWDATEKDLKEDFIDLTSNIKDSLNIAYKKINEHTLRFEILKMNIVIFYSVQTMSCMLEIEI